MITASSNSSIDRLSNEFSFLSLSGNGKTTRPLSLYTLALRYFFPNRRAASWEVQSIKRLPERTIEQLLSFRVEVRYKHLPYYIWGLKSTAIELTNWKELQFTPFHLAAITNRSDLLEGNSLSLIDSVDREGRTALHLAAFFGHTDIARKLIMLNANHSINAPIYGSGLALAILGRNRPSIDFFRELEKKPRFPHSSDTHKAELTEQIDSDTFCLYSCKWYVCDKAARKSQLSEQIEISSTPELLKEYYSYIKVVKCLNHSWEIDLASFKDKKEIPYKIYYKTKTSELEFFADIGCFSSFFLHKMAKSIPPFIHLFKNVYDAKPLLMLKEALDDASNQSWTSPAAIFKKIQEKKQSVILNAGVPKHAINIVITTNRLFIICNKGHLGRKPVEIFYFDDSLLTVEMISRLTTRFESDEAYISYVFTALRKALRFRRIFIEFQLEKLVTGPWQKIGNCSFKSPQTAAYMHQIVQKLTKADLLTIKKFSTVDARKHVFDQNVMFHNLFLFQQLQHLEDYLQMTTAPNRKFISNQEMFPELVTAFGNKQRSPMTHSLLSRKMDDLIERYPVLTEFKRYL